MIDHFGNWISFVDLDRTVIFWTFTTYLSALLDPTLYILILLVIMSLIIVFSIIDWHSYLAILILIPVLIIFILDIYWTLIYLPTSIMTGTNIIYSFTLQGFSIVLLFFVCFGLTYKEDIPQYGIKASIWMVPLIVALGFIFYTIMFGVSIEPLILQFGSGEGWINILILVLTVLSGSLSGMKIKQKVIRRKELSNY